MIASLLLQSLLPLSAQWAEPVQVARAGDVDESTWTGVLVEQYADGRPKLWKQMLAGKADGDWLEWYADGTLRYRASWRAGFGEGRWRYYHPNGQMRSDEVYVRDQLTGLARSFHANGQLATESTWLAGKQTGEALTYDAAGQRLSRKRYIDGQEVIDEARVFASGIISLTEANEWGITFTPSGDTAYFTQRPIGAG